MIAQVFTAYMTEINKELLGDSSGIYSLYDGDKLYYVGIAEKLIDRVYWHTHDSHQYNWDRVSFFVIDRHRYSKDIETAILRIIKRTIKSEPKGNKTRGKFEAHYKLQEKLDEKKRELKSVANRL